MEDEGIARRYLYFDFPLDWNLKLNFSVLPERPTPCIINRQKEWMRLLDLEGKTVPVTVKSAGNIENPRLLVEIPKEMEKNWKRIERVILDIHGLRDVSDLYEFMERDSVLRGIKEKLYGFGGAGLMAVSVYEGVVKSIIQQQISLKVAENITANVVERYGNRVKFLGNTIYGFPNPEVLSKLDILDLRKCGLSTRKSEYIKELSIEVCKGFDLEDLRNKENDEIIEVLTSFRGVGKWSAELIMVATIGRNVIPADDLGVRKAISYFYFDNELQPPERIRNFAERKFGRFLRDCLVYLLMAYRMNI